jgi:hypothetical protein
LEALLELFVGFAGRSTVVVAAVTELNISELSMSAWNPQKVLLSSAKPSVSEWADEELRFVFPVSANNDANCLSRLSNDS